MARTLAGRVGLFARPVCLLPDLGLAPAIGRELSRLGGGRAQALPRFVSPGDFLAGVEALGGGRPAEVADLAAEWEASRWGRVADDTRLQIILHGLLKGGEYFRGVAQSFPVMREMVGLFRELEDAAAELPGEGEFPPALEMEAELVREFWRAHAGSDESLERRFQGLERLGGTFDLPLVVVDAGTFPAHLSRFIDRVGASSEVHVLEPVLGDTGKFLSALWDGGRPAPEADAAVRDRLGRARLVEGEDFEAAAHAAIGEIRRLLGEGCEHVGVVLFHRVLARRVQALAADGDLLISDQSGWISSTLLVGATLLAYCDLAGGEAPLSDVADFVASPGVFFGYAADERDRAVGELRELARKDPGRRGAAALADARSVVLRDIARELRESPLAGSGARTLREWIARLLEALEGRALGGVFRGDAPAIEISRMLSSHLGKLRADDDPLDFRQFRAWLSDLMEENAIAPARHRSPVSFVSLGKAWLHVHDALVVLGADGSTLPSAPEFVFFNGALREQIGLPGTSEMLAEQRRRLATLLESHPRVSVVWAKVDFDGQIRQESPLFETLRSVTGARVERVAHAPGHRGEIAFPPAQVDGASVTVPPGLFPRRFGISGYDSLMDCPFRYFGERVLRLPGDDDAGGSREFGSAVHRVLQRFNLEVVPGSAGMAEQEMGDALLRIAREEFAKEGGMAGEIGLASFGRCVPALCDLECRRRRGGWSFHAAEEEVEVPGEIGGPGGVVLAGKVDRIDRRVGGDGRETYAVLDYKTSAAGRLREGARADGERPQVAAYAHLLERARQVVVEQCLLVRVRDRQGDIEHEIRLEGDYPRRVHERLVGLVGEMLADGVPLPANGRERTCAGCHIKGLCRRPLWKGGPPPGGGPGPQRL